MGGQRCPGLDPWVQEDPLEQGMETHSTVFPEKEFHGQRSLSGLQSMELQVENMTEATEHTYGTGEPHKKKTTNQKAWFLERQLSINELLET